MKWSEEVTVTLILICFFRNSTSFRGFLRIVKEFFSENFEKIISDILKIILEFFRIFFRNSFVKNLFQRILKNQIYLEKFIDFRLFKILKFLER